MIYSYQPEFHEVLRYPAAIDRLRPPYLGVDFEWNIRTEVPTIIGVSDGKTVASVPFESGWRNVLDLLDRFPGAWTFVGHNFIRAERVIFDRYGVRVPLDKIQDPIIWHYLTAAHLCKAGGKAVGEGEAGELERRGPGFMNIWTMCSIHTNAPCWKFCRGAQECSNVPCPTHEPFWYNGLDAHNPVLALPGMIRRAKLIGVDHLYPLHARLQEQFQIMQERGTWVNRDYIAKLRADFLVQKERLWKTGQEEPTVNSLPFNPKSHQQVKKFFKDRYELTLDNTQEDTIRKAVAENPEIVELSDLLSYQEIGSGPDRWYADKRWDADADDWKGYVVDQGGGLGTIHPNINFFTSSSRTACSNPNLQNIEKRRVDRRTGEKIGERMREAIVAPPGYNLYSADFSNAENRAFLHLAGYTELPPDLHTWMVGNMGIKETDEIAIKNGGPREASKTITHAQDYLEGIQLKSPEQLRSKRIRAEIDAGARLVFPDWVFRGQVVTFTGANLAKRSFGDASWTNRRKALEAGERYIGRSGAFPNVRDLQKRITRQVEEAGAVQVPEGYYLLSYDRTGEDRLKTAAAMWGQCLDPNTPVLKADLTWCRNGDLKEGDELVGIEEHPNGPRHRRLFPSIVESIGSTILPSYRVITDKGEFIASENHRWLVKSTGRSLRWVPTKKLRIGKKIAYLSSVWNTDSSYEAGYLAAAYDGEGSQERLSFYQRPNQMLETVESYLVQKGFHPYRNGKHSSDVIRLVIPNIAERMRLAGMIRLKRVETRGLWEGIHPFSGNGNHVEKATVLGLEALGPREVIAMGTTTKTFVAAGLFSHNSPVAHKLKVSLLNIEAHPRLVPLIPVHDEHLVLASTEYDPKDVAKWIQEAMEFKTEETGLVVPAKVKWGKDWRNMKKVP